MRDGPSWSSSLGDRTGRARAEASPMAGRRREFLDVDESCVISFGDFDCCALSHEYGVSVEKKK